MEMHFFGAKGGVGTSTAAAVAAITAARAGYPTTLGAAGNASLDDLAAILGIPGPQDERLEVKLGPVTEFKPFNVTDWGTAQPVRGGWDDKVVMVLRNDYLCLRRAMAVGKQYDQAVIIQEPERALDLRDAESVLNDHDIATFAFSTSIARYIDAGILTTARTRLSLGFDLFGTAASTEREQTNA